MRTHSSWLATLGSLWFAAVILVLLLVAMAFATIYETMHGTERALQVYYKSGWFAGLLGLLAANVAAALIVRLPFTKRQIGMVITHLSILMVLGGALVTQSRGLNGRLVIAEGQTVDDFALTELPALTVTRAGAAEAGQGQAMVDLNPGVFNGFEQVDAPDAPLLSLEGLQVEVASYLPDSEVVRKVEDDNPHRRPAIEVSLSETGRDDPTWVFAQQSGLAGGRRVAFRMLPTVEELLQLVDGTTPKKSDSKGSVKIEYQGREYEISLEQCTDQAAPVGETGYTVRVLKYLPHAIVGPNNTVVNKSPRPANPYIEAALTGPEGTETRRSFARFPDFNSMHGANESADLKLVFVAPTDDLPSAPVEVLCGPEADGQMYARFYWTSLEPLVKKLTIGDPVESPWPGLKFSVRRRFENARWDQSVKPVEPVRKTREPAVLLKLTSKEDRENSDEGQEMWVQKHRPASLTIDGVPHEIVFATKTRALGFELALDRFRLVTYPGTGRPRSFESHVTIRDPARGGEFSRVISMNQPIEYGGYSFYQSSYEKREGAGDISVLSVSRDPGQLIVFAGYIAMLVGMTWVLVQRMRDRRRLEAAAKTGGPLG